MSKHPGKAQSRRELFAGALRYATLGLLTAGGAALYAKKQRLVQQGICISDGICAGCNVSRASCPRFEGGTPSTQCGLLAALSAKKVLVGVNRDRR